jgi:uncharacterized protein YecE (DUF72 family)
VSGPAGARPLDIYVGCAGWAVPKPQAAHFPVAGSHLQRYAGRFAAVEINSSFYRPHRPATYARWAASVPDRFRFSVKMPREITHRRRLREVEAPLGRFLAEAGALGPKLGVLLAQLPPSLRFEAAIAEAFLSALRARFAGPVACEPRHASWFGDEADSLLIAFQAARVAADPAPAPPAGEPGGWNGLVYYRWHGTPRMYYSSYSEGDLDRLAARLLAAARGPVWCILDNTALGAATANALDLLDRLRDREPTEGG